MLDLSITEVFALISLNTLDSRHKTMAKTAVMRCIAAALLLDAYLEGQLSLDELIKQLPNAAKPSSRNRKELEAKLRQKLLSAGLLEEVPALLGCDYFYYSASVSMREYRTESTTFLKLTEAIRADILDDGQPSDQTLCHLWLLRESGCMYDLFAAAEQEEIAARLNNYMEINTLAKNLLPVRIHNSLEKLSIDYLRFKRRLFRDPFYQNINLIFPFLERRQAIFIDTKGYGENALERLADVLTRVESMGHYSKVIRAEDDPIVKIDNLYYQLFPTQLSGKLPIHGVRLVQCIPF